MIPCQSFTFDFKCAIHGMCMHEVIFHYYNPKTHLVKFLALCMECDDGAYKTGYRNGFHQTISADDWNRITPAFDEPICN